MREHIAPGKFVAPTIQTSLCEFVTLRSYIFISIQQITFKLGNFANFKTVEVFQTHVRRRIKYKYTATIVENKQDAKIERGWLKSLANRPLQGSKNPHTTLLFA